MILLIDNYDSFTYNLYQAIGVMCNDIKVVRNDEITLDEIEKLAPQAIIISPGPCTPNEAGISVDTIKRFGGRIPILGICLGHQSIAQAFGGRIIRADKQLHGKQTSVSIDNSSPIFEELPSGIDVARYHSLIAERETLPECLQVIAVDTDGIVMAVKHRDQITYGLQFHPESVLTPDGKKMINNWLLHM